MAQSADECRRCAATDDDATVADHALALMLAISRQVVHLDGAVRAGGWAANRQDRPTISGMRLGIIGLGNIGRKIALRGAAFEMTVGYHTRTQRPDVPWLLLSHRARVGRGE